MRYVLNCILALTVLFLGAVHAEARMRPIKPGTVVTTTSDNGRYAVVVTYGQGGAISWAMTEDGKELWNDMLMEAPGQIHIADNGETIAMTIFGWQDEGGASGIALYDKKGKLVKNVLFGQTAESSGELKWVNSMAVSPDGKYVAVREGVKNETDLTLYDVATGKAVWEKKIGNKNSQPIKISLDARNILFIAYNNATGVLSLTQ